MASSIGALAAVSITGAIASAPVALLPLGALWRSRGAPTGRTAACSASPAPRVAAAPPSAGAGEPSPNAAAAIMVDFAPSGAGTLPWKVQWQLQGAGMASDRGLPPAFDASSGDPQQLQLQEDGEAPAQLQPQVFQWTPFDRGESVRAAALEASGWDSSVFESRFADLAAVLPDLHRALPSLSPAQLLGAMSDPHATAAKVVFLKAALPSTNVGMLLLMHPPFLEPSCTVDRLLAGVDHAVRVLGGTAVAEEVLQWYPPLMEPAVLDSSVAQLRRLVPQLARTCLPSARGGSSQGMGPRADGSGDARQLVHLLGIVMQREGGGVNQSSEESSGAALWWGCA